MSQPSDDNNIITYKASLPPGLTIAPVCGNTDSLVYSASALPDGLTLTPLRGRVGRSVEPEADSPPLIVPIPKTERKSPDPNHPKGDMAPG
jgi:hypothetical protein